MNGLHDMGGMHGFGPVEPEQNEPVFHAPWEGRVYALNRAMGAWNRWNIDGSRFSLERLPPELYLRSYYERWLDGLESRLLRYDFLTRQELENGKPSPGSAPATPKLTPEDARRLDRQIASQIEPAVEPRFQTGQTVRARNIHPTGHTRLPRYARGKTGVVHLDHGVYVFPDTNAEHQGEKRQHVYSVRFSARELWGEAASPRDYIHIDLWDDYLEHA